MTLAYDIERLRAACEEADKMAEELTERHKLSDELIWRILRLRLGLQVFITA